MTERNLVSIRTVVAIDPIPGADNIEAAQVDGWTVVVKKGEFTVGDDVLYLEIDSALPLSDPRFSFLEPRGARTIDGTKYHVLKTAKLRGVYSQGLVLPLSDFAETLLSPDLSDPRTLAELLGVIKYEPPVPAELSGLVVGPFLTRFAPKTDEERLQNIPEILDTGLPPHTWVATEKIDGTSATYVAERGSDSDDFDDVTWHVMGRNWELQPSETNTLWRLLTPELRRDMHGLLRDLDLTSLALQGEVFGEGIQGNPLGMRGQHLRIFSVYTDLGELLRTDWPGWLHAIAVPVLPGLTFPTSLDEALEQADTAKSSVSPGRSVEGIVWRNTVVDRVDLADGRIRASFKQVSRKYLMRHDR